MIIKVKVNSKREDTHIVERDKVDEFVKNLKEGTQFSIESPDGYKRTYLAP